MLRAIAEKITGLFTEASHSLRRKHNLPIKVVFEPIYSTGGLGREQENIYISGETYDISKTGVGFIVQSIRVRENYLVGQDRRLNAEIDLPNGKVQMKIVGRRYEKVGVHLSTERFLVGAEIVEMSKDDREVYEHFLKYGKRRKAGAPSLEMGSN
ncbi:MAG: PilZ domain-containing protein [Acidobacteria bacterium]|nr:PilZ domain-containing protein [Acidobacteriota bacterium]